MEHEVLLRLSGSTRLQQPGGGPDETKLREAPLDTPDHEQLPMARFVSRTKAVGHLPSICNAHVTPRSNKGGGLCVVDRREVRQLVRDGDSDYASVSEMTKIALARTTETTNPMDHLRTTTSVLCCVPVKPLVVISTPTKAQPVSVRILCLKMDTSYKLCGRRL